MPEPYYACDWEICMKVKLPLLPRSLHEDNCPLQTMGVNKSIVNVNNMIVPSMNKFYNHVINVDKKLAPISGRDPTMAGP